MWVGVEVGVVVRWRGISFRLVAPQLSAFFFLKRALYTSSFSFSASSASQLSKFLPIFAPTNQSPLISPSQSQFTQHVGLVLDK